MAYSDKQFNAMQEEAIRRVREMQKRSNTIMSDEPAKVLDAPPPPQSTPASPQTTPSFLSGLFGSQKNGELFNLAGIKIDEEKALIGILIYILYKQGADIKLLLGLGYLLL